MGSSCSTIYDDIPDPSEGQLMWRPKNGKKIRYNNRRNAIKGELSSKEKEILRINEVKRERNSKEKEIQKRKKFNGVGF